MEAERQLIEQYPDWPEAFRLRLFVLRSTARELRKCARALEQDDSDANDAMEIRNIAKRLEARRRRLINQKKEDEREATRPKGSDGGFD